MIRRMVFGQHRALPGAGQPDSPPPGGPSPAWRIVAAKAVGSAHQRLGLPCQDAFEARLLPGGVLLAALADGAGTARRSEQGANWAVSEAMRSMVKSLTGKSSLDLAQPGKVLQNAFSASRLGVEMLASGDCEPPGDFAATLSCVIAFHGAVWVGQVGDGAVVLRDAGGCWHNAIEPQRGEYAGETTFITQPGALEPVEIQAWVMPLTAVAVMSDGLSRLAFDLPSSTPHAPFFEPIYQFACQSAPEEGSARLAEFLESDRVRSRTDDDKSLIVAVLDGAR